MNWIIERIEEGIAICEINGGMTMKIDCSKCKNCYPSEIMWGEYWCKEKEKNSKDGYVYDLHSLNKRFKEKCE